MTSVTTGNAVRRLAPLGGLLLVAAVMCGLLTMHGIQPSPGPAPVPSVLAMELGHAAGTGMPMSLDSHRQDGHGSSHDGHSGGQVCLAFLLAGVGLTLVAVVTVLGWAVPMSKRPLLLRLRAGPPPVPEDRPSPNSA
ncbi:hypothetical protein B1L11_29165 [Microbispora sp. GKU 823]|nr:hypothetical protein B1L11_29165 [Microbispora sp. GKU 823]